MDIFQVIKTDAHKIISDLFIASVHVALNAVSIEVCVSLKPS